MKMFVILFCLSHNEKNTDLYVCNTDTIFYSNTFNPRLVESTDAAPMNAEGRWYRRAMVAHLTTVLFP